MGWAGEPFSLNTGLMAPSVVAPSVPKQPHGPPPTHLLDAQTEAALVSAPVAADVVWDGVEEATVEAKASPTLN